MTVLPKKELFDLYIFYLFRSEQDIILLAIIKLVITFKCKRYDKKITLSSLLDNEHSTARK